jgi:hypothetical protein
MHCTPCHIPFIKSATGAVLVSHLAEKNGIGCLGPFGPAVGGDGGGGKKPSWRRQALERVVLRPGGCRRSL